LNARLLITMGILLSKGSNKQIALFEHYDVKAKDSLSKKKVQDMITDVFLI
jgi:hypothetical protein